MILKSTKVENLQVHIFKTREDMGAAAAKEAADYINRIIEEKGTANVVFAAAPSQNELLANLLKTNVDWSKVRGFHQDEYIGIDESEPAGFGNFLRRAIFDKVQFKELYFLHCREDQVEAKLSEYAELLKKYPADLIFLGIGENGHLAFNDPGVADFNDPKVVKVVELDDVCRQQQVNDGCFPNIDAVPKRAMTLTMSFIMSVPKAICVVPTERKANIIYRTLNDPISVDCPSTILRKHSNASLYLDENSGQKVL
ncbi:MAG: glucosamine-6-phosphate deaminase [Clostridiaceae bacterium]|nr:glucosamine-6-phosphate deaminase [Clostridiaceae bacterium]